MFSHSNKIGDNYVYACLVCPLPQSDTSILMKWVWIIVSPNKWYNLELLRIQEWRRYQKRDLCSVGLSNFKELAYLFFLRIDSRHRNQGWDKTDSFRWISVESKSHCFVLLTNTLMLWESSGPSIYHSHLVVCAQEFMVHLKFKTIISDSFCPHKIFSFYWISIVGPRIYRHHELESWSSPVVEGLCEHHKES